MENFRPNPEYLVKMPEELRIQQRLGQISMNDTTQAELTRILSRRAGDLFDAENFIGVITDGVAEYTRLHLEQRVNGRVEYNEEYVQREQEKFLASKMPKFITKLLTGDRDRQEVLWHWFGGLYEKTYADDPIDELKKSVFIQKHIAEELRSDPPRKEKKRLSKLHASHAKPRPHTTARHNGRH